MKAAFAWFLLTASLSAAQCIEVSGDRITAADLAPHFHPFASIAPETTVALTPLPGTKRTLTVAALKHALGRSLDQGMEVPEICVTRRSRLLTVEEITAAMRRTLPDPNTRITTLDYGRLPVPEGDLEFPRNGLATSSVPAAKGSPIVWRGQVKYGNGHSAAVWAKVVFATPARVTVAARTLAPGVVISPMDIQEMDIELNTPTPARAPANVIGLEVRREIPAGAGIEMAMLRPRAAVKRGESLRVTANARGAALTFDATAEADARVGDHILVRNPLNGAFVSAVVRDDHNAEIQTDRTQYAKIPPSSPGTDPRSAERNVSR